MPTKRTVPSWLTNNTTAAKSARARAIKHGYRSGLEEKNALLLKENGLDPKFETMKIPYVIPENWHKYTPDFPLDNGIIIECKGIFDAQDRAKHLFIKAQYPELDIRFVFSNPKASIGNGSKTTLAMWAEKNGYKFAAKLIPVEWLKEPGPQRKPEEVLKDGPFGYVKAKP